MTHETQVREIRRAYPKPEKVVAYQARCSCGWFGPERLPQGIDADVDAGAHLTALSPTASAVSYEGET